LFNQSWNSPKLRHLSPNVNAVIDYFNRIAQWVANSIVLEPLLANRAKIMKHHIMIANELRNLHNYHLMTSIISGLNNSAVLRLKWTKLKLPKHVQKMLEELEDLTNMEGSYKNFRYELDRAVLPSIPYLGVYLMDLTFVEDGNPDSRENLINWEKRKLYFNIINQIQKFQSTPYNLKPVESIQKFFAGVKATITNDRALYQKSLDLEPRNATRADIK